MTLIDMARLYWVRVWVGLHSDMYKKEYFIVVVVFLFFFWGGGVVAAVERCALSHFFFTKNYPLRPKKINCLFPVTVRKKIG